MGVKTVRETDLVREIRKAAEARGCLVARTNAGRVPVSDAGGRRYAFGGAAKGWSDLTGCLPDGRFLAIEVKVPGKYPSDAQWDFLQQVNTRNGVGFWADDLLAAIEAIEAAVEGYAVSLILRRDSEIHWR